MVPTFYTLYVVYVHGGCIDLVGCPWWGKIKWESLGFKTETESMAKLIMVKEVRRREGGVEGRRRLRERKRRRIYSGEKNGNGKWRGEEVFVKCPKPNHPKDAKGKIEECVGWGVCLFAARTRIGGERVTPITYYSSTSNTMLCSVGPRIPQVQAIANSSFSFCHLLFRFPILQIDPVKLQKVNEQHI